MILNCTCSHETQDKLYGKGKIVFNPMGIQGRLGYRCSVCKSVNKPYIAKEEKKVEEVK